MSAPPRPPRSKRVPPANKPSVLLTSDENSLIFNLLGARCTTLATAVVQVFLSEPPEHHQWCKYYCGVVCFVKDNPRKSFFIQVFDFDTKANVWEQELYDGFNYKTPKPFFHTFEADACQAGLNFADNEEACTFQYAIKNKLQVKQQKKQGKPLSDTSNLQLTSNNKSFLQEQKTEYLSSLIYKDKRKSHDKRKPKITKDDIGKPENFVHIQHVGWDPNTGFDFTQQDNLDANLRHFFKIAGVSEEELRDADTRKFIYSFLGQHGGISAAIQTVKKPQPCSASFKNQSSVSLQSKSTVLQVKSPAPLPPGSRNLGAPPPPPFRGTPPRPAACKVAPPPPSCTPPPPPPPPPPLHTGIDISENSNTRIALLDQIRKGTTLSAIHLDDDKLLPLDSRGALLNQIRQGIELKPINDKTAEDAKSSVEYSPLQDLAGALARALQERSFALQHTDDSTTDDDEEDEEEEEWDD